jgi:hypothetical protein
MTGYYLYISSGVGNREPSLLERTKAEDRECCDKWDDAGTRKASSCGHHILLCDSELKEALWVALPKMMHAGASGNVGIKYDKIRIPWRKLDQGLAEGFAK